MRRSAHLIRLFTQKDFNMSDYLDSFNKATGRGTCKKCFGEVQWCRRRLVGHKRKSCASVTNEEKIFFAKIKFPDVLHRDARSGSTKDDIDTAVAEFFLKTGTAFHIVDSPEWKELMALLNRSYSKEMPSSKILSEHLAKLD